ncbi:MAG: hypothetical protein ACR2JH_04205 [Solirubrobacteraceae bacterium]
MPFAGPAEFRARRRHNASLNAAGVARDVWTADSAVYTASVGQKRLIVVF